MNRIKQVYGNLETALGSTAQTRAFITGTGAVTLLLTLAMSLLLFGCVSVPNTQAELQERILAAEQAVNAGLVLYMVILDEEPDPEIAERVLEWTARARKIALAVEAMIYALEALGVDIDPLIDRYRALTPDVLAESITETGRSGVFISPD